MTLSIAIAAVARVCWGRWQGTPAPLGAATAGAVRALREILHPRPRVDVAAVARLTAVCLRAGLSLGGALAIVADRTPEPTRSAVTEVVRRARRAGLGPALAATSGPLGPLARRLAGAHRTGASLAMTIDTFERELVDSLHATRLARVRRLPVQLTVPLVLLILPGCVLLLVGPTLVGELGRLLDPLTALR